MPRPWALLEAVETRDGLLELRQRGERDFMISVDKRVLMTSTFTRSERTLAELGCGPIRARRAPRVLIGGLGLGYTLRAALDVLPSDARVIVAELNPVVVRWCRRPLAAVSGHALADPRVEVVVRDVTEVIRGAGAARFDAILFDLYVGPGATPRGREDPLYGRKIIARIHEALSPGGVFAVWGEDPDPPFEGRLRAARFDVHRANVRGGGPAHTIVLATVKGSCAESR